MRNLRKKVAILSFVASIGMMSMTSTAFAHVNDATINSTQQTAYQLTKNTISDSVAFSPQKLNNCFLSDSNDVDWYKVFLDAGTQTLTINSSNNNKIADVVSSDGSSVISEGTFGPSTKQSKKFVVATSGTYYIKIYSKEEFNRKSFYSIFVGAPYYSKGSYSQSLSTMSLTPYKTTSNTATFDLTNNSSIPDTAIVEHVYLNGSEVNKNFVNDKVRSIKANSQLSWNDISGTVFFDKNILNTTSPIRLKQGWSFKHSISSFYGRCTSYSLTPEIEFDYLYEDNDI